MSIPTPALETPADGRIGWQRVDPCPQTWIGICAADGFEPLEPARMVRGKTADERDVDRRLRPVASFS